MTLLSTSRPRARPCFALGRSPQLEVTTTGLYFGHRRAGGLGGEDRLQKNVCTSPGSPLSSSDAAFNGAVGGKYGAGRMQQAGHKRVELCCLRETNDG